MAYELACIAGAKLNVGDRWHRQRPARYQLSSSPPVTQSKQDSNITGVSQLNVEIGPKRLELAHQLIPAASLVAFLVNPNDVSRAATLTKDAQEAAVPVLVDTPARRATVSMVVAA